jgi:hypothetical protein
LVLPWWLFNAAPLLLAGGLALEHWGPSDYKPSVVMGGFLGNAEATKMKTELTTMQATLAAQNEENARLQKQLADFQARTQRVTSAYDTLYQRATLMAQAMSQAQEKFLELQAGVAKESQDGNIKAAQFAQMFTGLGILLGDKQMAAGGLAASHAFTNEATSNINHQLQQSVQSSVAMTSTWQQGLPDATTVNSIVSGMEDNPTPPAEHAPPPSPPDMYQSPAQQASLTAPAPAATDTTAAAPPTPQEPQPFLDGAKDRRAWEGWFAGLAGDAKAGASFWAMRRNDPQWRGRANCATGEGGDISDDFRATCEKAKSFLTQVDGRRTTEPDYKRGWNSI